MDYWERFDSKVAQTLANYLGIEVAGFVPKSNPSSGNLRKFIIFPDLDTALRDNNGAILQTMILSGLIHEATEHRDFILTKADSEDFWEKSFYQYLFDLIKYEIRERGEASMDRLQENIPKYTEVVYNNPPTRRDHLGSYYSWVQILELRPSWEQVLRAIELLKTRKWSEAKR